MATEGPGPALPSCPPFPWPWAPWGDAQSLSPAHPKAQASPAPCTGSALPCPLKSQGGSLNFSFSTWFSRRRGLGHGGASSVAFMQFGAALVCQALECVAGGWGSASAHSQGKPGLRRRRAGEIVVWEPGAAGLALCGHPVPEESQGLGRRSWSPRRGRDKWGHRLSETQCVPVCVCLHACVLMQVCACTIISVPLWACTFGVGVRVLCLRAYAHVCACVSHVGLGCGYWDISACVCIVHVCGQSIFLS